MTDNNLIGYEVKVTVEHMDTRGDLSPKSYDGRVVRDDGLVFGLQAGRQDRPRLAMDEGQRSTRSKLAH
jgi:hypothetical protein